MNYIDPVYTEVLTGYKCSCGNRTDWIIRGMAKTRLIECEFCQASIIMTNKIVTNG